MKRRLIDFRKYYDWIRMSFGGRLLPMKFEELLKEEEPS